MYGRNRNARLRTGGIVGVPPGYGDEHWDDVSLLIRGNTLTDLSGNNTLTNNGATVATGTYKFSTNGSLLFDGSNDYINAASTDLLDLAGGDWTIEAWVYLPDLSPNYQMISCAGGPTLAFNNTDGLAWQFYITPTNIHLAYNTASSYGLVFGAHGMSINTWYHVAVSRNGSTFRLFVDGSQVASATGTPSAPSSIDRTFIGIGNNTVNDPYKGNIENLRITKGVARYTSDFTPPTASFPTNAPVVGRRGVGTEATLRTRGYIGAAPAVAGDEHWNDVSLLIRGNALADLSANGHTVNEYGSTPLYDDTTRKKYASGSLTFDGTGDYVSVPDDTSLELGSGDFTIECWAYHYGAMSSYSALMGKRSDGNEKSPYLFNADASNPEKMRFLASAGTNWDVILVDTGAFPTDQWVHVAVTREGNTFTLWINGQSKATTTAAITLVDNSAPITLGRASETLEVGANEWNGNIEDFRVTKGVARYTADFSSDLPTASFPTNAPQRPAGMLTLYDRYIDNLS